MKPTLPDADPPEELREDPPTSVFSEERWRAFATEARAEPVHPEWARRTERSLRADLQGLGQSLGFAVHEGRCGTAQCVFTLGWTRATRDVDLQQIAQHDFAIDCARGIFKLPDTARDAPSTTELVVDCRNSDGE